MAMVIINGCNRKQKEGLKLSDLQRSYPQCYLLGNDGAAIRRPETMLETDQTYTLIQLDCKSRY